MTAISTPLWYVQYSRSSWFDGTTRAGIIYFCEVVNVDYVLLIWFSITTGDWIRDHWLADCSLKSTPARYPVQDYKILLTSRQQTGISFYVYLIWSLNPGKKRSHFCCWYLKNYAEKIWPLFSKKDLWDFGRFGPRHAEQPLRIYSWICSIRTPELTPWNHSGFQLHLFDTFGNTYFFPRLSLTRFGYFKCKQSADEPNFIPDWNRGLYLRNLTPTSCI